MFLFYTHNTQHASHTPAITGRLRSLRCIRPPHTRRHRIPPRAKEIRRAGQADAPIVAVETCQIIVNKAITSDKNSEIIDSERQRRLLLDSHVRRIQGQVRLLFDSHVRSIEGHVSLLFDDSIQENVGQEAI